MRMRGTARSLRWRLTALYGVLFFLSGAVLLAISGGYAINRSSSMAAARATAPAPGSEAARLADANATIRQLQHQLAAQAGSSQSAFSRDLLLASVIALGFMTLGSLLMGWVLAGRALRPVRQMTAAAQQISAHNLNERLAVAGPEDELKQLGDTIDGLLERLEAAFTAQRRFVANASHELRTPLATIRASLDVAVAKPEGAPPQTIALAARLRAELDRIDSLLEAFLVLARAQHRNLPGYAVLPLDYIVGAALADQRAAIRDQEPDRAGQHRSRWRVGQGQPGAAVPHGGEPDRQRGLSQRGRRLGPHHGADRGRAGPADRRERRPGP